MIDICDAFKKLDLSSNVEENFQSISSRRFKIPKVKTFTEYIPAVSYIYNSGMALNYSVVGKLEHGFKLPGRA